MARIRTIKPEFWSSPSIRGLDPWARLLYIALWNWADDHGRGTANARELGGFVFPHEEDMPLGEFRRLLGEVRRTLGVKFYVVDGRPYYAIPTWEKHQKIDKRSAARHPAPEDGTEYDPTTPPPTNTPPDLRKQPTHPEPAEPSTEPAETPSTPRRVPGAGTGEQGNRGIPPTADATPARRGTAQTILGEYIDHCTKRPPRQVLGQLGKLVAGMLEEGIDPDDIRRGMAAWAAKKLHPSTLPSVVNEVMNTREMPAARRPSTTDQRVEQGLALVRQFAELEGIA